MSDDLQERLRRVQTLSSQATATKARAEVEKENATRTVAEVKAELQEKHGVVTSDDLKRVRAELQEELESALQEAESALEKALA